MVVLTMLLGVLTVSAKELDKENTKVKIYNEDELIKLYIRQSNDTQIMDIEDELAKLKYEKDEEDIKDERISARGEKNYYDNKKKTSSDDDAIEKARDKYRQKAAAVAAKEKSMQIQKFNMDQLEISKKRKETALKYNLRNQLWNYYSLKKQFELLEKNASLKKSELEVQKTKLDLEMITALDLEKTQNEYNKTNTQIENLKDSLQMTKENLKVKLGIAGDQEVKFDIKINEYKKPVELSLDGISKNFKKNNLDIKLKDLNLKAEKEYIGKLLEIYIKEDEEEYQNKYLNYKKQLLDKYEYDKNIDIMLVNEYYSYKKASEDLNIAKENIKVAEEQFKQSKASLDAGQISQMVFDGAKLSYENQQYDLDKAIIAYNKALVKVVNIMNGISPSEMGGAQ